MRKDKEDTSVSNFHGCPFKYRARKQLELNFWRLTDSFVIHIIPLMLNLSTRWHTFTYLFNSSEVFHGHSFITIGSHCELCDISAKFSLDLPWKKKKITECPERCIWNTILQVVLFLKGSKNIYEWFVFVKWSVNANKSIYCIA